MPKAQLTPEEQLAKTNEKKIKEGQYLLMEYNSFRMPKRITHPFIQRHDEKWANWVRRALKWQQGFLDSVDPDLARSIQQAIHTLHENQLKLARFYIRHLNRIYRLNLQTEEILSHHSSVQTIRQYGIIWFVDSKNWIQSAYDQAMQSHLPPTPMHEYPLARSIKRHFVIHIGPTNSGKTHDALLALKQAQSGFYLSPLRLLALEIFEKFNQEQVPCSLSTGEEEIITPNSHHLSCTIEKLNTTQKVDVVVIDEAQMLNDMQRGHAWTRAILGAYADVIHVCCSPNAQELVDKLIGMCQDTFEVHLHERQTELIVQTHSFTFPDQVEPGDALIAFSRRDVLNIADQVKRDKKLRVSVIYGNLPPEARRKQVERFLSGETQIIVSTDAIGMGLNLPIKRVVFLQTSKFDGYTKRLLQSSEIKQIAGRAGRKGMYDKGYVASVDHHRMIKKALSNPDHPCQIAYLAPQESVILNIPFGTLREKLIAWHESKTKTNGFKKMDLTERFALLDLLEERKTTLSEQDQFRAISLPFAQKEGVILHYWEELIDALETNTEFPIPKVPTLPKYTPSLEDLENYYRLIDLYYSASRLFDRPMDQQWIQSERLFCVNAIHDRLLNRQATGWFVRPQRQHRNSWWDDDQDWMF